MKRIILLTGLLVFFNLTILKAGDYQRAWVALDHNDFALARQLLRKAATDPRYRNDALATLMFMDFYMDRDNQIIREEHDPLLKFRDPSPYFFAFWNKYPCLGPYQKLDSVHLQHLLYVLRDPAFNATMKAAATYFESQDEFFRQHPGKARELAHSIGAIRSWSITGPFDNTGGSGFDKDFGVLAHPGNDTRFNTFNHVPVGWFVPAHMNNDSWIYLDPPFPGNSTALAYAQSFVESDKARNDILCLGSGGSLKVWLNDKLLFSEAGERQTELDTYRIPCHLNAGFNRVLVQVGYAVVSAPNFLLRFTDSVGHSLSGLTAYPEFHPYRKDNSLTSVNPLPQFAESYFKHKISADPLNPVNYLLLSEVYLRDQRMDRDEELLSGLLKDHPDNIIILMEYLVCLTSEGNRTESSEIMEKIKSLDPHSFYNYYFREATLEKERRYTEALQTVDTLNMLTGDGQLTLKDSINIYAKQSNLSGLQQLIGEGVSRYPDNAYFGDLPFEYAKKISKDQGVAIRALEDYDRRDFNLSIEKKLVKEYMAAGQNAKGISLMKKMISFVPYSEENYNNLASYYYNQNELDSAISCLKQLNLNEPYNSDPYASMAYCYVNLKDTAKAVQCFKKAIFYNPAESDWYNRVRELEKKPALTSYFPKLDVNKYIQDNFLHPYDSTHHYYYLFDIRNSLVYAKGASQQEVQTAIGINDNQGIEDFNTISIGYNNNFQHLTILKAFVDKKDGSRIAAEVQNNQIVFTKLSPGDLIYYRYIITNNETGKLGREFWDKFFFNAFVPTKICRYNLIITSHIPIRYSFFNDSQSAPVITPFGKYTLYSWELRNIPPMKNETLIPAAADIGEVLHLSTISSWNVISQWYSEISRQQPGYSYVLNKALKGIFPEGTTGLTDEQKAKALYSYIVSNISYSSIPFRQSAYVPQKAAKTLITATGDCKDMSALFVTLARMAGLKANLVLVNTRENGQHAMELPSMEFNHCIASYNSGNQVHYVELTDPNLPFGALPLNLYGAQILEIPYREVTTRNSGITRLETSNAMLDDLSRNLKVKVTGDDISVNTHLLMTGSLTSSFRSKFQGETPGKIRDNLKQGLDGDFGKSVDLGSAVLGGVNQLSDSVSEQLDYQVKNEVIRVNEMYLFKPEFMDIIANMQPFSSGDRSYPVAYDQYENTEHYSTEMEVDLPRGALVSQIPKGVDISFGFMHYTLKYRKLAADKILISRDFTTIPWKNIPSGMYLKFEDFFKKIIDAESKYIVYK